jgi:dCTP deaminase
VSLLLDRQIDDRLYDDPSLATGVPKGDFSGANSKIQASSLSLTIGEIFVPGPATERSGSASNPMRELTIGQGHTAVIRTAEVLDLGPRLAGIAFPPATLSLKGILMTNPGHIDPGYKGPLHITVINMSRTPFPLRAGDRIMRVLFFGLDGEPSASFSARHANEKKIDVITTELLDRLSIDFLDVEKRARKIANKAVRRAAYVATAIPVVVALLALFGNLFIGLDPLKDSISKLDARLSVAESKQAGTLEDRIRKIEDRISAISPPSSK